MILDCFAAIGSDLVLPGDTAEESLHCCPNLHGETAEGASLQFRTHEAETAVRTVPEGSGKIFRYWLFLC